MSFRRHVLFLGALAAPLLQAATEFENGLAPVDLIQQFTGGTVYRSLPDGFPVAPLPAGTDVRLIGSMKRGDTVDVLLETTQHSDGLRAALMAAYTAAGWIDVSSSAIFTRLCHDEAGMLTFYPANAGYNGLRLTLLPVAALGSQTCAQIAGIGTDYWPTYFFNLLPQLTPPPQAQPSGPLGSPFVSMSTSYTGTGSGVEMERGSDLAVPNINIHGMYAHFAARLAEQGWTNDSEDSGMTSASSVWYKTVAPPEYAEDGVTDTQLTGIMIILHKGGDNYRVTFNLHGATNAVLTSGSFLNVSVRDWLGPPLNEPQLGIRGIPSGFLPR